MGTSKTEIVQIIGSSKPVLDILRVIEKVAPFKSTVLIQGESGTGKELFARHIHVMSPRRDKPIVVVNCGAIPENLLESELFGHMKGSFTGAHISKEGLFEKANGGTLFLDEIGELPLDLQVKILRAIQEEEIMRVGGRQPIQLDIRIIAATNRSLDREVQEGRFRQDLFYRLNVVGIEIPPLRERPSDIKDLTLFFVERYWKRLNKMPLKIGPGSLAMLKNYDWPGNVRELENAIEQTVVLMDDKEFIEEVDLPLFLERRGHERRNRFRREALDKRLSIHEYTKAFIDAFQYDHTEKEIAKFLGITTKTLWEKRKQWSLPRPKR